MPLIAEDERLVQLGAGRPRMAARRIVWRLDRPKFGPFLPGRQQRDRLPPAFDGE
ncbi:MAG: hypothetical protein QM676_10900 [Novosphingobium sp.]